MKIAITGTIGSGKTEVANYLRDKGYDVFDCDEINRQILNENAYELLKDDFIDCFDNEVLNKQKLADVIFNDEEKKHRLESLLHPLILDKLMQRDDEILFAEVPLLFESQWDQYFDRNILVICDRDIAIERLINRGISSDEANRRINNQMPVQEKIKKADRIIYNNGSLSDLHKVIQNYLDELC